MTLSQITAANFGLKSWDEICLDCYDRAVKLALGRLPVELRIDAEHIVVGVYIDLREKSREAETLEDPVNYFLKCVQHRCYDLGKRYRREAKKLVYLDAPTDEEERNYGTT